MSTILLTGIRIPYALDLAQNLAKHGHRVVGTDSMRFPIGRSIRAIHQYHRIHSPRADRTQFRKDLLAVAETAAIDYVVPTSEEVLYVASLKTELESRCRVICPDFELLEQMHSKADILELARGCGVGLPETDVVDAGEVMSRSGDLSGYVVKPEYSRCGAHVLIDPSQNEVAGLIRRIPESRRFLIQEKIRGTEYCTYSIAHQGKLRMHVTYEPVHRAKGGPCFYFRPLRHEAVESFVEAFVQKHNLSGQVSFDLIVDDRQPYLIECNPRTTSGVHLATVAADLGACLTEPGPSTIICGSDAMLGPAMILFGLRPALAEGRVGLQRWRRDFLRARNIVGDPLTKPAPGFPVLSALEFLSCSIRKRVAFLDAISWDIEWNGAEPEA